MGHVSLRALEHDTEVAQSVRDQIAALIPDVQVARDHARRLIGYSTDPDIKRELEAFADGLDNVVRDNIEQGALVFADRRLAEAECTYACHAYTRSDRVSGCI